MDKSAAPSRCTKPKPRQRSSAGAAVARSFAKMAKPRKVAVMVKETGGSETVAIPKDLRGGERVLSMPVTRFAVLLEDEDEAEQPPLAVAGVTMVHGRLGQAVTVGRWPSEAHNSI